MAWFRHLRKPCVDCRPERMHNEPPFGGSMPRSPWPHINLSDSVHQQLNKYAFAASTAGVGMLALEHPDDCWRQEESRLRRSAAMTQGKVMSIGFARIAVMVALLVSPVRNAWASTEKVLYAFAGGSDGYRPLGGLIFDRAGNLYGTTIAGGLYGSGTVFELRRTSNGWREEVLHSFVGGRDGTNPIAGLIMDK